MNCPIQAPLAFYIGISQTAEVKVMCKSSIAYRECTSARSKNIFSENLEYACDVRLLLIVSIIYQEWGLSV